MHKKKKRKNIWKTTELVWLGLSRQCLLQKQSMSNGEYYSLLSTIHSWTKIYLCSLSKRRGKNASKLNFFILKLWEFVRLFAAMACVNLVFPPRKLNSNGTLQRNKRGFNAAFSHWTPSVSIVQFTVQMSKLNGLGKTHRERKFVVELKLRLRSLFYYEQIKWIKVPSFSSTVEEM